MLILLNRQRHVFGCLSEEHNLALLEIPPGVLIDQDQTQIVARAKLFVDLSEGGRQVKAAEEQADRDGFAARGAAIHNLKAHQRLAFVILVGRGAARLAADDRQLHVLDLEAHEQEIDAADDDVLEMILAFAVLELDVQAVLDADVHLNAAVELGWNAVAVDPQILLADHILDAAADGGAYEVAETDVDAVVTLILLLNVLEVKGKGLRVGQLAGGGELLVEGEEFVVGAAVEEHLNGTDKLHLDTGVLKAFAVFRADGDDAAHRLAVHVEWGLFGALRRQLGVDVWSVIGVVEDDVYVYGRSEEEGHGGVGGGGQTARGGGGRSVGGEVVRREVREDTCGGGVKGTEAHAGIRSG